MHVEVISGGRERDAQNASHSTEGQIPRVPLFGPAYRGPSVFWRNVAFPDILAVKFLVILEAVFGRRT